ncbi:hypothetical protein EDB81DRAFT_892599 [Dactylonectria macrodidyma]|uniref:Uncharacterized protein n=1 Tax=Dactylonectria macrodidyma TaxID=307937 RepID=A0A9P9DBQ7_9HYPO|nr:hypothetical protein EDB81DRAFT_892599 [Dactylonectria macrodidyma]
MSTILRYHLRIMGEQGVGKTSLELRFKVNNFSGEVVDPVPCMEGYYKHTVVARLPYLLGIEKLVTTADYPKKFVEHEIRNSDGFLLVYSVASRSSFDRIQEYHRMIHRFNATEYMIARYRKKKDWLWRKNSAALPWRYQPRVASMSKKLFMILSEFWILGKRSARPRCADLGIVTPEGEVGKWEITGQRTVNSDAPLPKGLKLE